MRIFNFAWSNLQTSKAYIERIGLFEEGGSKAGNNEEVDLEEIKLEIANNEAEKKQDEQQVFQEMIHQLIFDLFSFLSARVSHEVSGSTNVDIIAKFLEPILNNFDE